MTPNQSARERAREWANDNAKGGDGELPARVLIAREFLAMDRELSTLRAKNEKLVGALRDAVDTIHDEFCGQEHHPLCEGPAAALQETEDGGKG